jgi:hypothetical protein
MPHLGVTVLPEYLQYESVTGVLDRLQASGVNAVTTSPYVMELADSRSGAREPPIDAGAGDVRLLDRELWGQRELWVRTAPSFVPKTQLYAGLRYQPPPPDELTRREGSVIREFISSARERSMTTCFQVQSAIPPGYRVQFGGPHDEDQPRMHDGRIPAARVANNGSLASPEIIGYQHALLRDLCSQYPDLDAIRVDWPEYPPYSLDDMFVDFSEHARIAAERLGFDFQRMQRDTNRLYAYLHGGLAELPLLRWDDDLAWRYGIANLCLELPGVIELVRFKAQLVDELLSGFRRVIDEAGRPEMGLIANLFPWPWSLASGATTYRHVARHCSSLAVKLYGMHWKMMFRFYCDQLLKHNPDLDPSRLVSALLRVFDIMDASAPLDPEAYAYPGPEEAHGVSAAAQRRKIDLARSAAGDTPVHALVHGYGPAHDFRSRFEVAKQSSPDGIWINRYGYLSDEKLAIVGG